MEHPIKIVFETNGVSPDIRYIGSIPFCTLEKLKDKIIEVYQLPSDAQMKITWIDKDGDNITISSDTDLGIAIMQMKDKLAYQVSSKRSIPEQPESNSCHSVVCDICENPITGYRYKCLECSDYDLCSSCENAGNHAEHIFLRLPNCEIPMSRYDSKILFSAARDLKKAAYAAARRCHRTKRDVLFGGCKRESKSEKDQKTTNQGCQDSGRCPFTADIAGDDLLRFGGLARDHLYPILQAVPEGSVISDIIRNATEAVFGALSGNTAQQPQNEAPSTSTSQTTPTSTAPTAATANVNANQPNVPTQEKPVEPAQKESSGLTEMDWTIVNNSQVPPAAPNTPSSIASSTEKTPSGNITPPEPGFILHPDPVIARGLAQLYEMGFSNEGDILVALLKRYSGNVSEVVKTLCNMG